MLAAWPPRPSNGVRRAIGASAVTAATLLCADPLTARVAQDPPHLEIDAVATFPLPDGFQVRGALLLSDGTPVVWGASGILIARSGERPEATPWLDLLPLPEGVEARGVRRVDGGSLRFEVLERGGAVLTVGPGQTGAIPSAPGHTFEVIQAVDAHAGWMLQTVEREFDSPERARLSFLPHAAPSTHVLHPGFVIPEVPLRLSSGGGGEALAIELSGPFRTWVLTAARPPESGEIHAARLLAEGVIEAQRAEHGLPEFRTVALPVLRLDRGYLVQLADLSEDRRLLILIDDAGQLLRTSSLQIALGFIVADPASRLLVALRDTGAQEIVLYRWRWRER